MDVVITAHRAEPDRAPTGRTTRSFRALAAGPFQRIDLTATGSPRVADALVRAMRALPGRALSGRYRIVDTGAVADAEDAITFVNCLQFAPGQEDAAYPVWKRVNDHMVTRPGYLAHTLHRRVGDAPFGFVNVVRWASAESFAAARDDRFRELTRTLPFVPLGTVCRELVLAGAVAS